MKVRIKALLVLLLLSAAPILVAAGANSNEKEIADARARVEQHLTRHLHTLRMRRDELRESSVIKLRTGIMFRFDQYFEGVRVRGQQLHVIDREGTVTHRSSLYDLVPMDVRPRVASSDAQQVAATHLQLHAKPRRIEASLVILTPRSINDVPLATTLAWQIDVSSSDPDPAGNWNVWIDAQTGDLIAAHSEAME